MAERDRVVVVGAGVVGLASAYYLGRADIEPIVLDAGEPGSGASGGNMGWIAFAPTVVAPLPGPGVVQQAIRWLAQRDAPLRLLPRADLDYLRWLLRFALSCRATTAAAGLEAINAFNARTPELFDELKRDCGDFELESSGMLEVYRRRDTFERARTLVAHGGEGAAGAEVPSREETLAAEPTLREDCVGAIRDAVHLHLRP